MSRLPYSRKYVDLYPNLDDPSLVGAWGMVPVDNSLVDLTGNGNDGTPGAFSVVEPTILGNFRRYLPNSGVASSALGGANAFPLNDLTLEFWYRIDPSASANAWGLNYYVSVNDGWGIYFFGGGDIRIYDDIDNAGALLYATSVPKGKIVHCVAVMDSLENKLYVDKNLVGSGTSSSDDWSSFAGTLYHGSRATTASPMEGIISPIFLHNEAKDQAWVTAEYEKGAQAIPFMTDFGVQESLGNQTAGYLGGPGNMSPFEILSGTWRIDHAWIDGVLCKVMECVVAGDLWLPGKYFDETPTGRAFGGYGFWINKADASTLYIGFISTNQLVTSGGYNMRFNADESVVIEEAGVGNVVAGGTINHSTWHLAEATRRYDGLFEGFIDGVSFGTGTDLTVTTSNGMVLSADAGDLVGYCDERGGHNWVKYNGVWRQSA